MKPVVLLIGRLPHVIGDVARQLQHLPIEWLGAHDQDEVIRQLDAEPRIACVIMGAGLDDATRGALVGVIAARRPDVCMHLKDRASGPEGLVPFVERVVRHEVLGQMQPG
ncbi:MAG: hypothetical protein AB3N21_13080 [Ruegeria sp.]|uniref:hypothetical protein n=1 Tax=Ruegeria sp. TaxID=1879320 RepID=UPI00349E92E4